MPGNGRSGRPKDAAPLTVNQVRTLVRGLDLTTAAGLQAYLRRLSSMHLQQKIPSHVYVREVAGVNAQRALIIESEVDTRVKKILDARDEIRRARGAPPVGQARDIGPPPDGFDQGLKKE